MSEALAQLGMMEEEEKDVEELLEELGKDSDGLVKRLNTVAATLESQGTTNVTRKELAQLYKFLAGDVVPLLQGGFAIHAAILEGVDEEGDDDEEEEQEDGPIDEETVNLYLTALTSYEAFTNLSKVDNLSDAQRTELGRLAAINKTSMDYLEESVGPEIATLAQAKLKEVAGGGVAGA